MEGEGGTLFCSLNVNGIGICWSGLFFWGLYWGGRQGEAVFCSLNVCGISVLLLFTVVVVRLFNDCYVHYLVVLVWVCCWSIKHFYRCRT